MPEYNVSLPKDVEELKVGWNQESKTYPVKDGKVRIEVPEDVEFCLIHVYGRQPFTPDGQPFKNPFGVAIVDGPATILPVRPPRVTQPTE